MTPSNNYELTKLMEWQIPQMARLEQLCFSQPWSEQTLRDELTNPLSRYFVCCQGQRVCGYLGVQLVLGEAYITNVAVDPALRRQGIGSLLVKSLLDFCHKQKLVFATLEVRESNAPARALYERFGFVPVGKRKNYYEQPREDAVLMTLVFEGEQNEPAGN